MKIVFLNACLLNEKSNEKLKNVIIEDGIITKITPVSSHEIADRVIDLKGNLLLPGFVNAHAHMPMSLFRGVCDDEDLSVWHSEQMLPREAKLTSQDIYYGTMLSIAESVRAGITSVEDLYFDIDAMISAYKTSGMRARIGIGAGKPYDDQNLNLNKELDRFKGDLICPVAYAHSIYSVKEEEILDLVDFSAKKKIPISMHLSETLKEVGDCTVKHKRTPVEYIEDLGVLDRECTLYHCVHADKDDFEILKRHNANIVLCPSSNIKLASGIPKIYAMQNAGLNLCLGTDSVASNNRLDIFKEMFLASTLAKVDIYNAEIIKAKEVYEMATNNACNAIFKDKKLGKVEVGYIADLIVVDKSPPHLNPWYNDYSQLVYSAMASDVLLTMVNGKILYENGNYHIGEDIDTIYKEIEKRKEKFRGI